VLYGLPQPRGCGEYFCGHLRNAIFSELMGVDITARSLAVAFNDSMVHITRKRNGPAHAGRELLCDGTGTQDVADFLKFRVLKSFGAQICKNTCARFLGTQQVHAISRETKVVPGRPSNWVLAGLA
jgi:hypothetical protein